MSSLILAKFQLLLWWFKNKQTTSLCPQMWVVCAVKLYLWVCIFFFNVAWSIWSFFSFRLPLFCVYIIKCLVWQLSILSVPYMIAIWENTAIVKWIRCEPFWTCALYVFGHITHTMNNVCIFSHDKGTREITVKHCIALHSIAYHCIALHCMGLDSENKKIIVVFHCNCHTILFKTSITSPGTCGCLFLARLAGWLLNGLSL